MPEKVAFICVRVEETEGRYFAYSDDLPGLHLCGDSLQAVRDDMGPMIQQLYKLNTGLDVRVERAVDAQSMEASVEVESGSHTRFWAAPVRQAMAA